jgi:tetratricopeptide (TPR) repeat protein
MGGLADPRGALQSVEHEAQAVATMLELAPDNAEVQRSYQMSIMKLGDMQQAAGDLQGALASFQKGLGVAQRLQQRTATPQSARLVAVAHNHIAIVQDLLGDGSGSLRSSRESLGIYRKLSSADPRDELMQRGVAIAELNLGTQLALVGERQEGLRALDDSVAIAQSMVAANPGNLRQISTLAGMYEGRGDVRMHLREPQLAASDYAKACELYTRAHSADPGDEGDVVLAAECRTRHGRALLRQHGTDAAARDYQQALILLKALVSVANADVDALYLVADSYAGLGDTELAAADPPGRTLTHDSSHLQHAREWYASSVATWRRIPEPLQRRSPSLPVDSVAMVIEKLHGCESALAANGSRPRAQTTAPAAR